MKNIILTTIWFAACVIVPLAAAQNASELPVPSFVRYTGTLADNGRALTGEVEVTFSLYNAQQGGAAVWMESQKVKADSTGRYSVILGAATFQGLPNQAFASGEARWLGVQVQGYDEQPRVMLLSVPYAMKAGDAETIGGLPPSAFMRAAAGPSGSANGQQIQPNISSAAVISGSGSTGFVPLWSSSTFLGTSTLFQTGSGSGTMTGINTTTPAATLDVGGSLIARGALQLPSLGTANAAQGYVSQPLLLQGSAYNSASGKATAPSFQWQTEPTGNNSSNPAGTLNLLYGNGSGSPGETGLNIAGNGLITFASGQSFPGTGTITGVTAGLDLLGGGSNGNVTLNIDTSKVVTGITPGTDLIGGGTGGVQTLGLDTSKVPELGANNIFTGTEQFSAIGAGTNANTNGYTPLALGSNNSFGTWMTLANTSAGGHTWNFLSAGSGNAEGAGNLGITDFTNKSTIFLEGNVSTANVTASGAVSGLSVNSNTNYNLGGQAVISANLLSYNEFFGSATGNTVMTGVNNFAAGIDALSLNTTGSQNTAFGEFSLVSNNSGAQNTGAGYGTLSANTTGNYNTASGFNALAVNTTGNLNTAFGMNALVSSATADFNTAVGGNSMFSNTTGTNNAGFGNAALYSTTTGSGNTGIGYGALNNNQTGSNNTALGINAGPLPINYTNLANTTAIGALAAVTTSNSLVLGSIKNVNNATADTNVGIGTTAPLFPLTVVGNSTFSPVLVTTANSFGTWLQLGNTSTGGHTWNILSAGSGNAEGVGNLGITDLTGKSTIWLEGNVHVSGNLVKGGGSFQIDDPLDPAHKYLSLSFVVSPVMMNVYNGNVTTDRHGVAVVRLPAYFEALNRDFRYQLTVIGQFAQAIVAREINDNHFTIRTNHPGVKVSWQVTGIRQDAYANAYRIPNEEEKPQSEQGRYLNPELFGASAEMRIGMRLPPEVSEKAGTGLTARSHK